ncbi:MAG: hypothetical protein AAF989_01245 [Planctomycetota bacterium]
MTTSVFFLATWCVLFSGAAGCRTSAPLYVWQPPTLESAVGKRVVMAGIEGPTEITAPLVEQLVRQMPGDAGREFQFVNLDELRQQPHANETLIRLVSAESDRPSDVAVIPLARERGFDFVLQGEVLQRRHRRIVRNPEEQPDYSSEPITISWRLIDTSGDEVPIGYPISVSLDDAIQRYPDLALLDDRQAAILAAAARDTNRLIAPSIRREDVPLAVPRLLPDSREVRKGNALARSGRWAEAKSIWKKVADRNPLQAAAVVNLALAAAAEQDFATAKELARKAIRRSPSGLAKERLVWIELRQREYHEAFSLPDPEEGWFVTR